MEHLTVSHTFYNDHVKRTMAILNARQWDLCVRLHLGRPTSSGKR